MCARAYYLYYTHDHRKDPCRLFIYIARKRERRDHVCIRYGADCLSYQPKISVAHKKNLFPQETKHGFGWFNRIGFLSAGCTKLFPTTHSLPRLDRLVVFEMQKPEDTCVTFPKRFASESAVLAFKWKCRLFVLSRSACIFHLCSFLPRLFSFPFEHRKYCAEPASLSAPRH